MINPALSSAPAAANAQTSSIAPPATEKMTDKTSSTTSASGNATVSLSDKAMQMSAGAANELQENQRVSSGEATESRTQEANETYSGLSYGSNMQSKANVYAEIQRQTGGLMG